MIHLYIHVFIHFPRSKPEPKRERETSTSSYFFFFFSRPTDVRRVNREEMLHARAYQRDRQISMPCVPPAAA